MMGRLVVTGRCGHVYNSTARLYKLFTVYFRCERLYQVEFIGQENDRALMHQLDCCCGTRKYPSNEIPSKAEFCRPPHVLLLTKPHMHKSLSGS
jgi:hypothetical protein